MFVYYGLPQKMSLFYYYTKKKALASEHPCFMGVIHDVMLHSLEDKEHKGVISKRQVS
jgi:hypothetical protein